MSSQQCKKQSIFSLQDNSKNFSGKEFTFLGSTFSNIKKYGLNKVDVELVKEYNNQIAKTLNPLTALYRAEDKLGRTIGGTSGATKDLIVSANGATISQNTLAEANAKIAQTSKLAALGSKALSMALNVGIWFAVSAAIQLVVKVIDESVHANERAIEKAKELTDSFKSSNSSIQSNITTLKELRSEYNNLSHGVDENGKNIGLSAEQYDRYKGIVQEIVDMNPSLIEGYDSEGLALVNRNNLIQEAINLQEKLNESKRQEYLASGKDVISGANAEIKESRKKFDTKQAQPWEPSYTRDFIDLSGLPATLEDANEILKQFNLTKQEIMQGDPTAMDTIVQRGEEIISVLGEQNNLSEEQKSKLHTTIDLMDLELQKIDEANKKKIDFLSVYSSDKTWFKDVKASGYLQEFDGALEKLIKDNPIDSIESLEIKTNNLGESFQKVKSDIPDKEINRLREQFNSGKIDQEQFNNGLTTQIKKIEDLSNRYAESNPVLSEFLKLLSDGFKDFSNTAPTTPFDAWDSTIRNVNSRFDESVKNIEDLQSSLKDLDTAIQENNSEASLSGETVSNLILKYPELTDKIIKTADGYKIEKGALESIRTAQIDEAKEGINSQIEKSKQVLQSTQDRLKLYLKEIGAISNLTDAYKALSELTSSASQNSIILHDPGIDKNDPNVKAAMDRATAAKKELAAYISASEEIEEAQNKLKALEASLALTSDGSKYNGNKSSSSKTKDQKEENKALQDYLNLLKQRKDTGFYTGSDSDYKYLKDLEKALPLLKEYQYRDADIKKQDTDSLNKSLYDANLAYQQQVLSVAKERLQNDIDMQRVEENSQEHLDRLNYIYKELTAGGFQLANTAENRLALEKEILNVNQSLYKQRQDDLDHAKAMEAFETTQEQHLQNQKKYIEELITLRSQYQYKQEEARSLDEKIASEQKQYYKDVVSYQQSKLDHDVAMGRVQENSVEYINRLIKISKRYAMDEETRWQYQEKIYQAQLEYERQLIEAKQKRIQQQKDDNDSVISAATGLLDEEIKKLQEEKDALSNEDLEGSYGAQMKDLQDRIDALKKVNDEHEREIELEKAKAALEAAKSQKTKRIYREGQGFVYDVDTDAIKDAQENLDKLNQDKVISDLEKEKDALEEQLKNQEEAYDKQIDALEKYKEQWSNIADVYQKQQDRIIAAQKLGADWESKILSMRQDTLNNFQDKYVSVQQRLADVTEELEAFNERKTISDGYREMYYEDMEEYEEYTQQQLEDRAKLNDTAGEQQALAIRKVLWTDEIASYKAFVTEQTAANNALIQSNQRLAESYREAANAIIDKANAKIEAKLAEKSGMKAYVKYAKGTPYVPKTDEYIVNEEGPELIVEKGPGEAVTLKQGSSVIPANKTQKILQAAADRSNENSALSHIVPVGKTDYEARLKKVISDKNSEFAQTQRVLKEQQFAESMMKGATTISNVNNTNNSKQTVVNYNLGNVSLPGIKTIKEMDRFLHEVSGFNTDIKRDLTKRTL